MTQALGQAIKRLQSRNHRDLDAALQEIGTTLAQWDALRAVDSNPGASAHALAEYTFQTDQSFGALVGRLIEKGLVRREQGQGRAFVHHLTAPGRSTLTSGARIADRVLSETFAPLSAPERRELLRLVTKVLVRSEPER